MAETISGRIVQINISRGGVPKLPVMEARVGELGLAGDLHDDIASHGGPTRALCLYTIEEIERLQAEGHPIFPGAAGENVTLRGVALARLVPGTRLALGDEVVVEITGYTTPCKTIRAAFNDGDFSRISHKTHPGESRVYARVLREGVMRTGDSIHTLAPAE
ncbi:MAG: MOSC domain-containing protein [Chloroflexota bacterium]|nr:MOSC domain-containing protein [Chloroflexota bacterium]